MNTPILFIIFNRPDVTKRVFAAIKKARPKHLYIAADGPRDGNNADAEKCRQARAVIEQVDWDCEVKTLFREKNLGCKHGVSGAIDWFFENVEQGIILEDDCLPSESFFRFCAELLDRYKDDGRVMHIAGTNDGITGPAEYSYFFSGYPKIWGWATWRRAWEKYDVAMSAWPGFRKKRMREVFPDVFERWQRINVFDDVYEGKIDTWDYTWHFTMRLHNGLAVVPRDNMILNIGFGKEAVHTKSSDNPLKDLPLFEIEGEIKHPPDIVFNQEFEKKHKVNTFTQKRRVVVKRMKQILKGLMNT